MDLTHPRPRNQARSRQSYRSGSDHRFIAHRPIPSGMVDDVIAHVLGAPIARAVDNHVAAEFGGDLDAAILKMVSGGR